MSNQKLLSSIQNNNTLKTFVDSKFFENFVLQKEYYPYQFNGWTDKLFYGLVDNSGRAIYPKNSVMALNSNLNSVSYKNLIFVVDAFNDLKKYHTSLQSGNKFENNNSIYINPQAARGAVTLDDIYIAFSNNTYKIFQNIFLSPERVSSIKTFNDFIKIFISFVKISAPIVPLNRSTFVKSKYCDPNLNGLNIDLKIEVDFNNYQTKADVYLSDPNFDIFIDSAKRFGFYVDKNAPWRLVADLQSPVMRDYYNRYNFTDVDDLLSKCYHVAHYSDLEVLKNLLISFWNTFANSQSTTINQKLEKNCSGLFAEVTSLQQLEVTVFDQHYNKNWLLRLYIFIKLLESGAPVSQNNFEIIFEEAVKLNKYLDENSALDYINRKVEDLISRKNKKTVSLTTPDEFVKMLSLQETTLPVSGINF